MARGPRAGIGFKSHTGWALGVVVVEDDDGIHVVAKQRVTMQETFATAAVFHVSQERGLSAAEARPFIESTLRESVKRAKASIASISKSIGGRSIQRAAILAGNARPLPPLDSILRSHPLIHTAEGELYRDAVANACDALGLPAVRIPAKDLDSRAAKAFSLPAATLRARLDLAGKSSGKPWTAEHRDCALAAWLILQIRGHNT